MAANDRKRAMRNGQYCFTKFFFILNRYVLSSAIARRPNFCINIGEVV